MSVPSRLHRRLLAAWMSALLALVAFTVDAPAEGWPMMLPTNDAPLAVTTKEGRKTFSIEVADDPEERERGLMFRQSMGDDHGMLFVFSRSRRLGFWMKNTPMPLDLLFIGKEGTVHAIERGEPYSTASISPNVKSRFVLELKAGTAQKSGIEVGDRFSHPLIAGTSAD